MTTLYFEASDGGDLRKTGFSKDGKHQSPQIYIGLLVGLDVYAIGYDIFEEIPTKATPLSHSLKKSAKNFI